MTRAGNLEYVRRAGTLALCVAGFVSLQRPALAGMFLAAGLTLYLFLPVARAPQGALVHYRLPAVVIPDILGFALTSFFFAMPVWFGGGAGNLAAGIHPMAVLTWPMACGSLVILAVAANHASAWLRIEEVWHRPARYNAYLTAQSSGSSRGAAAFLPGCVRLRRGSPRQDITPRLGPLLWRATARVCGCGS